MVPPVRLNYSLLIWAGFILLALNAFFFTFVTTAPHIRYDVFRHLDAIVLPLLEGREGISVLWSNHHSVPLLHLIQIANLKFFDFQLNYDAYLGVCCQVLFTFLVLKCILSPSVGKNQNIGLSGFMGAILIVTIAFGFNSLEQYTWPLVAAHQYLYLIGIVLYIAVDGCVRSPSPRRYLVVAAVSLLFMFANASYGSIFLTAMVAVLLLVFVIERRSVYLRATALLVVVGIGYYSLLVMVVHAEADSSTPSSAIALVKYLLGRPWYALQSF
jgi:hypothetical protein